MKDLLLRCGLNETEACVLEFLLKVGPSRGSSIATRTGINRPTVYSALSALEKLGAIARRKAEGATIFHPSPVRRIPELLKERAHLKYTDVAQAAKFLDEELAAIREEPLLLAGGLEVTTLRGLKAVYSWLVDSFSASGYDSIFNPQVAFAGPIKQAAKDFLIKAGDKKLPIREIVVRGPLATWWKKQIKNPSHIIKEVDLPANLATDINLCGGTVCMVNYAPHSETAILIRNPQYYESMQALFEAMWAKL